MEEKIAPLILTQNVNKKYLNVWKQVEDMRKMNGKEVHWDTRCYVPIGVGIAIASAELIKHKDKLLQLENPVDLNIE